MKWSEIGLSLNMNKGKLIVFECYDGVRIEIEKRFDFDCR